MVCLGIVECQHVHRSALDYFLAILVVVAAIVAARLLVCAVAHCLGDYFGGASHHHHHHHSPTSTDVDEDTVTEHRRADWQERQPPEVVEVVAVVPAGQGNVIG
ncbi:hypothetical protein BRADI_3g41787v3 [Brachypodium distachyon]|uniref:Uncharacterized protein n=1 Tax=Brachypodium distachyon TaxID=15368 RepID=A0A2K2D2L6_BRADI|nr:hypothetical protein BRADI_3g41787v3 [Brachypodium distachyon]